MDSGRGARYGRVGEMVERGKRKRRGGNGKGGSVMHPTEFHKEPPGPAGAGPEEPRVMDEVHIDCQGRKRRFRLQEYHRPIMSRIEATELLNGEPVGMRLVAHFNDDVQMPPYYEIRRRIADRLATRDLVRDPESGGLVDLTMRIRAQVRCGEGGEEGPDLIIDGDVVAWAELGRLLNTYEGWGLRIEIEEAGEE
jgi:hypothetical protein